MPTQGKRYSAAQRTASDLVEATLIMHPAMLARVRLANRNAQKRHIADLRAAMKQGRGTET